MAIAGKPVDSKHDSNIPDIRPYLDADVHLGILLQV